MYHIYGHIIYHKFETFSFFSEFLVNEQCQYNVLNSIIHKLRRADIDVDTEIVLLF